MNVSLIYLAFSPNPKKFVAPSFLPCFHHGVERFVDKGARSSSQQVVLYEYRPRRSNNIRTLKAIVASIVYGLSTSILSTSAFSQDSAGWVIDYDKSELGFAGAQNGTKFNGAFTKWTASINLDPNDLSNASIETSVDLASATTGDKQKDRALPGSDWFDVKQTPTATFKSTKISNLNGNSYQAVGTLSLKGVSKSITLPFTLMIDGRTAKAQGKTSLIRMDYNIGEGEFANGKWVDANVDVTVSITAAKP